MAEDLLQPPKNGKTLEEVGYGYFNDLTSRSFFQCSGSGNQYLRFVMHDLVHDLATLLGGEFYLRREELCNEMGIGTITRHLSFSKFSDTIHENYDIFVQAKLLRTFFAINFSPPLFNIEKASCNILLNLKCLRVLSFQKFRNLDELPDSIDELIHLRYLNLSSTNIKTLPEPLCNLYNLQTLKLRFCFSLTKLPNDMQNLVNLRHLDIYATPLKEMPREMGKLSNLQHLSSFQVGKHVDNGIKELGKLSNLHGLLSILKLENVMKSSEALEAKIMNKKYLEELWLTWSEDANDHFTNSQSEMDILGNLQPSKYLKRLGLNGYRGTKFAKWIGDPSYHNLTELSLFRCPNCCILPPLGQLNSLKKLTVRSMGMVETIGNEYGDSFSGTLFPSLEYLEFDEMTYWEIWNHSHESDDSYPLLKTLRIIDCPKLKGDLPSYLPMLETIDIERCNQLGSSLPKAFAIRNISILESNKVALHELPLSLKELSIQGTEVTECLIETISVTLPTSLQKLDIMDCSSTISFPEDCLFTSLKLLSITNCKNLKFPKQNHQLESLQYLLLDGSCDSLTTLPLDILPNLKNLQIHNCENIESLSSSNILPNLCDIEIRNCPKFVSFPSEGLSAPNLKSLYIFKCTKLKSLPCHINTLLPKLQEVKISECPKMEKFPEGGMPPSLRTLEIKKCEKLLRNLSLNLFDMMLSDLSIGDRWDGFVSFPNKDFALLPPSLTSLNLWNMSSLHTLDCTRLLHLTSLQQLTVEDCPKLENMEGERLPASLIKLEIIRCPLLEERCRMKHPQIWPKISHIKGIQVDCKWI